MLRVNLRSEISCTTCLFLAIFVAASSASSFFQRKSMNCLSFLLPNRSLAFVFHGVGGPSNLIVCFHTVDLTIL